MINSLDAIRDRKDSRPDSRRAQQRQQHERTLEANEFINAILIYPVGCEFSLWNLQGDMGIRFSCKRRNCVPADLDFAAEIELAKKLGWIEELDEDLDFTEKEQRLSRCGPIRYGASFVRTASTPVIKAQRERFIGELVAAQGSNHIAGASNS